MFAFDTLLNKHLKLQLCVSLPPSTMNKIDRNDWCFRPRFYICKAILGRGQPGEQSRYEEHWNNSVYIQRLHF